MAAKKRHGSGLLSKLIILGAAVLVIASFSNQQLEIRQKEARLQALLEQAEEQGIRNAELERLIAMGDEDEYLEMFARKKLDFAYDKERIFVDVSAD